MSERMNKEQAIEILKAIKEEDDIKYCNYQERYYKALDIAIESLEQEEIKDLEDLYLGLDIAIKILEKQREKVEPYERKE